MFSLNRNELDNLLDMYDEDLINSLDMFNVNKILNYLTDKGVYYARDILDERLELFFLDCDEFIKRFEELIGKIGDNYVDVIGEDSSYLDMMYK